MRRAGSAEPAVGCSRRRYQRSGRCRSASGRRPRSRASVIAQAGGRDGRRPLPGPVPSVVIIAAAGPQSFGVSSAQHPICVPFSSPPVLASDRLWRSRCAGRWVQRLVTSSAQRRTMATGYTADADQHAMRHRVTQSCCGGPRLSTIARLLSSRVRNLDRSQPRLRCAIPCPSAHSSPFPNSRPRASRA